LSKVQYSKIEFVVQGLEVTRITATRYLDEMTRIGLMSKQKLGRDNYYINIALFNLLSNVHEK
jgi:DNA-binding IclR family transcriptional regulator